MTNEVDYSRKWYVMIAVAMSLFLVTIDGSIVNVALPTLQQDFDASFATVQWVVLVYLLTQTTLMLSVGRLGDMIGKKSIFTTGFVVFTLGSVLCGLATTIEALIAFRVLQAIGAAMTLALGIGIVTEAFPPSERGRALGIIGSSVSVGVVVGPTLGGLILNSLSWHWIFFVNLPVGILGTWMALRFVPSFKPKGRQTFDYAGAFTLFVSLLAFLLALTLGESLGFSDVRILLLLIFALTILALFIAIELKRAQPMVDLRLFRNRLFSVNLITGFMTFVSIAGLFILMPFYLQNVLGYDALQTGLLLAVLPVMLGITAPIAGSLSDRLGTRPITVLGLSIMLIGYFAMSTLDTQTSAIGFILRVLPIGVGMGVFQSPNNSAIMSVAPRERLGVVSGLLTITRSLGQTTGIAVLGALWTGQVLAFSGGSVAGGATAASPIAQVAGLNNTILVVTVLMALSLLISVWGLLQERKLQRVEAT